MNEVELKFLEINVKETIRKLEVLGAKKVFDGDMNACYFEKEGDLLAKKGEVLRIRQEGEKVQLAHKKKHHNSEVSVSDETQIEISDYKKAKEIFLKLGFEIKSEFAKHRISYKLDNFSFELDTPNGIPTFLEIEAQSEEGVRAACELLKLDFSKGKSWHAFDVQQHYAEKRI